MSAEKAYLFKFSDKEKELDVKDEGGTLIKSRKVEKAIIGSLFLASGNLSKDLSESLHCIDLVKEVEDESDQDELKFTKKEVGFLIKGWEHTAGQRPPIWLKCPDILTQIAKPEEIEIG